MGLTRHPGGAVRLAVAATAFCVLSYELTLTRVFSVLFRSPYVFLILSIAVCGLGVGSALAALGRDEADEPALAGPLLALAVLLPLPLLVLLTVGRPLIAEARGATVAVLTAAPYLAAGLFLARAFRAHADDAGRLYFCDLSGAGLAALVTARFLSAVGGLAVPLWLGAAAAAAALVLDRGRRRGAAALLLVLWAGLGVAQQQRPWLDLPPVTSRDEARVKPLFQELATPSAGAEVHYTEWSSVARTDVVSNTGTQTLFIWTDGDVPTQMEPFQGDLSRMASYDGFIGFVPYALRPKPERVLCIGPGGGLDVLLALRGGARTIEPVEINPAISRVVGRFRQFYGDLYSRPEVQPGLIIDEGRSYLSRSPRRYDVIYFALAKTATTQQGGMALVDNYLYTVEAFRDYYRHLSDHGLLALVFQSAPLTDRCLVTGVSALMDLGLDGNQIADRLAYLQIPTGFAQTPYQFLVLLSRSPFTPAERAQLKELAVARKLAPRFVPGLAEREPYRALRAAGRDAAAFTQAVADQSDYLTRLRPGGPLVRLKLTPVTDDWPFYADLAPGLNPLLVPLLRGSVLVGLLAVLTAWAVAAAQAGGGATWTARVAAGGREALGPTLYFAGLGAGFLLVEVALVQKLVLVLGYPTLSLTVILFTLLLAGAAGGAQANRGTPAQATQRLPAVFALLVALQVIGGWALPTLGDLVLAQPLPLRVAAVVAVVAPLGFLMGQPYPTGLRWLGVARPRWVPLAWAVNGVLSVTGSVLAASAASLWGYRCVMLLGGLLYLATALVGQWWWRPTPERPRDNHA